MYAVCNIGFAELQLFEMKQALTSETLKDKLHGRLLLTIMGLSFVG